ncbi:Rep [Shanivirus waseris]|uniref:Rep n=1 Tax=uncultured virus TaxID=340016 RepID=A0A2K9LW07_9VIRU|nr:Rep [uncultured virus]
MQDSSELSRRDQSSQGRPRQHSRHAQAKYWMLTIPQHCFVPYLPPGVVYIKGQLESGHLTGYLHWQLIAVYARKIRRRGVLGTFGPYNAEPTGSAAANDYVWKEDTRVEGTQFELGRLPFKRNCATDWDSTLSAARSGRFSDISAQVQICHWRNLCAIRAEYMPTPAIERTVAVYWGRTGTGKSRRAWEEAGLDAYPKIPSSKFWDGYRGQDHVVVDEFRGDISIGHLLRWCDRYPCLVDIKGSSVALQCRRLWFTSNLDPMMWYPNVDQDSYAALLRRFEIVHFE